MLIGVDQELFRTTEMTSGNRYVAGALALAAVIALSRPSEATEPVFYISMRGLLTEAAPTFVVVEQAQTAQRTTAIAGCDGHTYYATATDAAAITTARANGEVVQLHRGPQGAPPQNSAIKCIIDAAGT